MGLQHPSALALVPPPSAPWNGTAEDTYCLEGEVKNMMHCMGRGMSGVYYEEWCVRLFHMFSDSELQDIILASLALFSRLCHPIVYREVVR